MPRCMYCGQPTVIRRGEITNELTGQHGPGKCCNPCNHCRDGVPHALGACTAPNGWADVNGDTFPSLRIPVAGNREREAYWEHTSSLRAADDL